MGTSTGAIWVAVGEDSCESKLQILQVSYKFQTLTYLHFETSYIKCKPMLVQYIGNCTVLIFNINNGIKEHIVGMSHLDLIKCSSRIFFVIGSLHMMKSKKHPHRCTRLKIVLGHACGGHTIRVEPMPYLSTNHESYCTCFCPNGIKLVDVIDNPTCKCLTMITIQGVWTLYEHYS